MSFYLLKHTHTHTHYLSFTLLLLSLQAEGLPHRILNIYDYDSNVPTSHKHDVSLCYQKHQMRHFTFDLPHDSLNKSRFMRENLKYAVLGSLKEAGQVSPLRINRLEVYTVCVCVSVCVKYTYKKSK